MGLISEEPRLADAYDRSGLPKPLGGRIVSKWKSVGRRIRSTIVRISPLN